MGIALPFIICGLTLGPLAWRAWQTRQILAHGVTARATVMSVQRTDTMINYQPVVKLTLQVTPESGAPFTATLREVMSVLNVNAFQPGHVLIVKYNPQKPGAVAIVPAAP
jgi:hypothetical protein